MWLPFKLKRLKLGVELSLLVGSVKKAAQLGATRCHLEPPWLSQEETSVNESSQLPKASMTTRKKSRNLKRNSARQKKARRVQATLATSRKGTTSKSLRSSKQVLAP